MKKLEIAVNTSSRDNRFKDITNYDAKDNEKSIRDVVSSTSFHVGDLSYDTEFKTYILTIVPPKGNTVIDFEELASFVKALKNNVSNLEDGGISLDFNASTSNQGSPVFHIMCPQ